MSPSLIDYRLKFSVEDLLVEMNLDTYALRIYGEIVFDDPDTEVDHSVGHVDATYFPVSKASATGDSLHELFDAVSSEAEEIYHAFFDISSDEIRVTVDEEFGGNIMNWDVLIIEMLWIEAEHRGRRLGLAIMLRLIERFAPHMGIVASIPYPQEHEGPDENASDSEIADAEWALAQATQKLWNYYGRLGFVRIGETNVMGLCTSYQLPSLEQLCPDLTD